MTHVERLAGFASRAAYSDLSEGARSAIKERILDALGCALGALDAEPPRHVRRLVELLGGAPNATLIGGGRSAADRAALYNGALVRYLDFNDSYLAPGETCHPSDNLAAVLAAAELAGASGTELMTALAVAYQVQCRLSEVAPVRDKGFDHTVQLAWSAAAGASRALGLDAARTAHALAISGTANNALRVTRTGALSQWKGLAAPNTGAAALTAALLASQGVTGPGEVFEGDKGFYAFAGPFAVDWSREGLEGVRRTIVKHFNAEVHSQSAIEGLLELRTFRGLTADEIERVDVDIFDVAFKIIGGGEEGDKQRVTTKEEADHSLPYLIAVALLDGVVTPAQFSPARIQRADVQDLLLRVRVHPDAAFSRRFPEEVPCRLRVRTHAGNELVVEKRDYLGFHTRPLPWKWLVGKFDRLATPSTSPELRGRIAEGVERLEELSARELGELLSAAATSTQDAARAEEGPPAPS